MAVRLLCCSLACAITLWSSRVAAEAMSSGAYAASTADEARLLADADRAVQPGDVRAHPEALASVHVVWTGISLAATVDGRDPVIEHHYYDFVVEGDHSVWLSPLGEGSFCLLDVPASSRAELAGHRHPFVIAYGSPIVHNGNVCLRDVTLVVTDLRWSTLVLEYGPNGGEVRDDRHSVSHHPETGLFSRFGYRVAAGYAIGGTDSFDRVRHGPHLEAELRVRLGTRNQLAIGAGLADLSDAARLDHASIDVLFRHEVIGIGVAAGPVIYVPLTPGEPTWIGLRYAPFLGNARGDWGVSFLTGGTFDVVHTDGQWAAFLTFAVGIDGNLGHVGGIEE